MVNLSSLKVFLRKKSILFILYLLLFFLLTCYLGSITESLKFTIIVPLSMFLGFGYTAFLKNILPIKNILTYSMLSIFFGLWLNTIIIFLLGILGVSIGYTFFFIFIPIVFVINIFLFFRYLKEEELKEYFKNTKLETIDKVWLVIFFLLFLLLLNAGLETFTPAWDNFVYWGVDAKYIFLNSKFRDGSFIPLVNHYIPFFPLQINYVYLLYGKIIEQSASFLSLIYGFLGTFLVYSYIIDIRKSDIKKSLLYLGLVSALYVFFIIHYVIFSLYADLFLSVIPLVYAIVLFNKKYDISNYWQRLFIISLLSFTLYFTKTHFQIISITLLGFYIFYDWKFLFENSKKLLKNPGILLSILLLVFYIFFVKKYVNSVNNGGGFEESMLSRIVISGVLFENFKDVVQQLLSRASLFVLSGFLYLLLSFFFKQGFNWSTIKNILLPAILVAIPVAVYTFALLPLSDLSMLRYLGLTYFLIPLVFIGILPDLEIKIVWQRVLVLVGIACIPMLVAYEVAKETLFDLDFSPHSGSYSDYGYEYYNQGGVHKKFDPQKEYFQIREEVLKIIPKDAKLMVLDYVDDQNQVANTFPPGLYIKYYLLENVMGGPYSCFPENCYSYFFGMKPDYLLIYDYRNYWPECNNLLEKGKNYLIEFDKSGGFINNGTCVASQEGITELKVSKY